MIRSWKMIRSCHLRKKYHNDQNFTSTLRYTTNQEIDIDTYESDIRSLIRQELTRKIDSKTKLQLTTSSKSLIKFVDDIEDNDLKRLIMNQTVCIYIDEKSEICSKRLSIRCYFSIRNRDDVENSTFQDSIQEKR